MIDKRVGMEGEGAEGILRADQHIGGPSRQKENAAQ